MRRSLPLAALLAIALLGAPAAASTVTKPLAFARGASKATVAGSALRGESIRYELGARAGQRMTVSIMAEEDNAVFQIYAPGWKSGPDGTTGKTLVGAGEGEDAKRWSGSLPASGKYAIVVGPTRGNASYELTVSIK